MRLKLTELHVTRINYSLCLIGLLYLNVSLFAQIEYPGKPIGNKYDYIDGLSYIQLEDALVFQSNSNTSVNDQSLKIDEFAATVRTNLTTENSGKWTNTPTGRQFWRLGITSRGASSLSVTFGSFKLKPGIKVFVYDPSGSKIAGAFTFRNNSQTSILAVTSIMSDSIIVEVQTQNDSPLGELRITSVSIGLPDNGGLKDEYYGWSSNCEVDINCIHDSATMMQKHSVCRLVIERPTSKIRCTGTLINNTANDGKAYVLTAGHCIKDEFSANRTIFYFNYESPYCGGPDGQLKSVSGSFLRSRPENLDFALVELIEKPPIEYLPLYSGWDVSGNDFDTSYVMHHPEGDVKKYTDNSQGVLIGSFSEFDENTHWHIPSYNTGTTEGGSSGAPLFDDNNKIVGILTGGGAACNLEINDFYQRMFNCWDDYPSDNQQLKKWLDPLNSGRLVLSHFDPYLGTVEELSNIAPGSQFIDGFLLDGWGYITGHNSKGIQEYAERFYRNGSTYIYGINLFVSALHAQRVNSKIILKIWEGDDHPEFIKFSKEIYNAELSPFEKNTIRLDTLILVDRHFFIGYEVEYLDPVDTFALSLALNDDNSALCYDNGIWQPLSDGRELLNASLAITPLILDFYPPPEMNYGEFPYDNITLYPNPAASEMQIIFKNKITGDVEVEVYDLMGNRIQHASLNSPERNFRFETNNLSDGIYLLKISYDGLTSVKKFIIFR